MSGLVIFVEFKVKPGAMAAFRALIDENARASVRDEPGCRRFDVFVPVGEEDRVLLYEIYDDAEAFAAHMRMPHFLSFDAESAHLVAAKTVTKADLVCEG